MKKICVQKANEIEIEFNDKSYVATFNMESVMYMQMELQKTGIEKIPYQRFAAVALYSGIKVNHEEFSMDEAVALIMTMRPADVNKIVEEYTYSINGISPAENEEALKKALAQIMGTLDGISA